MTTHDLEARRQEVTRTFNAAAARFDAPGNTFWNLFGGRTVSRMGLEPGWKVLDLACGTGASAVPAALKVGPKV